MTRVAELTAEITADTRDFENGMTRSQQGLLATVKSSDQLRGALSAMGAATDDAAQTQNQLAAAQANAAAASSRLAAAQQALAANTHPEKQQELARDVANAQVAMDRAGNEVTQLTGKMNGLGAANQKAGMSFTELASMVSLGKQAYQAVAGTIKSVIDPTIEYADQVRNLGRSIGATAEESSKLIQAADDVFVSVSSLEAGFEAAIRKGVEPTIEGLGKLADQYNAIADPIARTKFLMDNFGRSGADLAPLMAKGAAGIKALGEEAKLAGLVMSQEALDAALKYKESIDRTEDSVMALKMALAQHAVPAITGYLTALNENITVQQRYNRVLEAGMITKEEINAIAVYDVRNAQNEAKAVLEVAEARMAANEALTASATAFYKMIPATDHAAEAEEQAAKSANYWTREMWKAVDGANATAKAVDGMADSQDHAANAAQLLAAGLAGKLQGAQEDYLDVMSETTPEIARLTEEIDKYRASQGKTFTFTQDATTSANEYELATLKAAKAVKELAEFTGDDALELAGLKVSADHAQESVVKLGEGLGFSKDFTIDHTKALAEDSAAMAELVAKQAEAEAALKKTTAEMILQLAATALGPDGALEWARSTGLMSQADYDLTKKTQELTDAFDTNNDHVVSTEEGRAAYLVGLHQIYDATVNNTSATDTLTKKVDVMPSVLAPAAEAFAATAKKADSVTTAMSLIPPSVLIDTLAAQGALAAAESSADLFHGSLDRIPRTVDVTVNTYYASSGGGSAADLIPGHNNAAGGDFIVPAGYPHDSFQMNVQSGEHVVVTPAGGTGTGKGGTGDTYNFIFNNAQPISIPTALQTAKAAAGAW